MRKEIRKITNILWCVAAAICSVLMFGCSDEPTESQDVAIIDPVKVTAQFSDYSISRAYVDEGIVENGNFTLTYPSGQNQFNLATVEFGREGATPAIGFVIKSDGTELKWKDVSGTRPVFHLDNIPANIPGVNANATEVYFTPTYNPFVAGVFDDEEGRNDLLWGERESNQNDKNINFDLHHNMARIKLEVTVNKENELNPGDLDLEDATVEISSLILSPVSYNRLDGSLFLGDEPVYETFALVTPEENKEIEWGNIESQSENIKVYTSQDFVLPPQTLLENENRPRLYIRLKNGAVYSGIIPYAMMVIDSQHPAPGYPMTLSFLKEHILTIRTLVTEQPPELAFEPVWVTEWVDKGKFSLDGHQAGIYTADEFYKLIAYYNGSDPAYQLQRYGVYSETENKWTFTFWNTITLDYNRIFNTMHPGQNGNPKFQFTFSGYGVDVEMADGTLHPVTPAELTEIVSGELAF